MNAPTVAAPDGRRLARWRPTGWLVPALDALIEGAWIAVIEAALAATGGTTPLGPLPFAVAAGAAIAIGRRSPDRTTALVLYGALYVAAVVVGGLLAGTFWGATGAGRGVGGVIAPAFGQGAAALMALAVFRGSRHSEVLDDDLVNGSLLQWGFPLLALPWLYGAQLAGPERDAFAAAAFPATLVFAAAGLLALGLARLDSLSTLAGVNWRSNRAWFVLLGGVLGVMVLIAIPAAFLLGTPLVALAYGLFGPLWIILGPIGAVFEKLIEFIFLLITPLIDFVMSLVRQRQTPDQPAPIGASGPLVPPDAAQGEPSTAALIILGTVVAVIAVVIFVLLLRATARRRGEPDESPDVPFEEREFRPPAVAFHRPHLRLPHRRQKPATAAGAYLAFLDDLDDRPGLARRPDEPPATHAARLRGDGFRDPRAGLLAADYALERYALRELPPRETARALRRWQSLREAIRRLPTPRPPAEDPR